MRTEIFLSQYQIFTIEEARIALKKNSQSSTLQNLLAYHIQKGNIIRIRKGLYYTIPKGNDPKTYPVDPYLIASKLTSDAVLAYHTSLGFHGKLHSLRNDFVYITQKKTSYFTFRHLSFKGISTQKRMFATDVGIEMTEHQGCPLRLTNLERTFVDVLNRPSVIGSWEEIWKSLESIEYLDLQQVLTYAKILNHTTTCAIAKIS